MRVLLVHNYYQQEGGEDAVVKFQLDLLSNHGDDVALFAIHNDSIRSFTNKVAAFLLTIYNPFARRKLSERIREFKPDIVHVHNFFPQLSPSIFDACRRAGVPSVLTLHNFRILCPTGFLYHDEAVRERSLHHSCWWTVGKRVYHNSFMGTLAVAMMVEFHKWRRTWNTKVDRLIALTEFAKSKFVEGGISEERIVVKWNAVLAGSSSSSESSNRHRSNAVYVGRLSEEKGVRILVRAWKEIPFPIRMVGTGPLADLIMNTANDRIIPVGKLSAKATIDEISRAAFVVLPSVWYEMFPVVVVEAFSCGVPVIASNLGGLKELVKHGVTGLLFKRGDPSDLAYAVRWALEHPNEMAQFGANARAEYAAKYTPEADYVRLSKIYKELINTRSFEARESCRS